MNACFASSRSHVNGHHLLANLVIPLAQQRTMQVSLVFSPTLDLQHSRLAATDSRLKTLTLGYASHQIDASQLNQAIETLKRGRALLWSEMCGLRTSIDQIRLADSRLAQQGPRDAYLDLLTNNNVDGSDGKPRGDGSIW